MAKWTLKLHNPCYRKKPFDLEFEGDNVQDIINLLEYASTKLKTLCEVLDKNAR